LIEHNPLYHDVIIDYEALALLPVHGMLSDLFDTSTFSTNIKEHDAFHSRYDQPDLASEEERESNDEVEEEEGDDKWEVIDNTDGTQATLCIDMLTFSRRCCWRCD